MLESKIKDPRELRESAVGPEKIGQEVLARWNYLFCSGFIDTNELSQEISEVIQEWFILGKYILPKSQKQIQDMLNSGQLVALMGRDTTGKMRFITACMYSILGENHNGNKVIEVGGLTANKNITTKRHDPYLTRDDNDPLKQTLVFPINNYGLSTTNNLTYGAQVVSSVIELIKIKHPDAIIIATARSQPSQNALIHAGFVNGTWTREFKNLSCDDSCKGLIKGQRQNCNFADKEFTTSNDGQSGCHLLVLPQEN